MYYVPPESIDLASYLVLLPRLRTMNLKPTYSSHHPTTNLVAYQAR